MLCKQHVKSLASHSLHWLVLVLVGQLVEVGYEEVEHAYVFALALGKDGAAVAVELVWPNTNTQLHVL